MKKLIILLTSILFVTISFLAIKQFEYADLESFLYNSNEGYKLHISKANQDNTKLENFEKLTTISKKYNLNIVWYSYHLDEYGNDKVVIYTSLGNEERFYENVDLVNGNYIDPSNTNDFLSTSESNNINQKGTIELFHSFYPIEIRPLTAAVDVKEVKGIYEIKDIDDVEAFKQELINSGFDVAINYEIEESVFLFFQFESIFETTCLTLLLLILLAVLFDMSNNYKTIAIGKLHGDDNTVIGRLIFKRYFKLFVFSLTLVALLLLIYLGFYNQYHHLIQFLGFLYPSIVKVFIVFILIILTAFLMSKQLSIAAMIKNRKPVKFTMVVNIGVRLILSVLLLNGVATSMMSYQELKATNESLVKWNILKQYNILGINSDSINEYNELIENKDDETLENFIDMYHEFENQGAFYINPSYYYFDEHSDMYIDESNQWGMMGQQVQINKNYLLVNPIHTEDGKIVSIPETTNNTIDILVPSKYKNKEKEIKQNVINDYSPFFNENYRDDINVNIVYVKDGQSYFSFNSSMAIDTNYEIFDPVAVIVNTKFDSSYLLSTITMGNGYYTKNTHNSDKPFTLSESILKKYDFDYFLHSSQIAYATTELILDYQNIALTIELIYCGFMFFLLLCLLFFTTSYFLDANKQVIAIQYIFGYSFIEKYGLLYLGLLVFWQFSLILCNSLGLDSPSFNVIGSLVLFDFSSMTIMLLKKEHNLVKDVLIDK